MTTQNTSERSELISGEPSGRSPLPRRHRGTATRGTSQHHGHDDHDDYHVDHDQFDDDQQVHPSSQLPSYPGVFPAYKVVPGTSYEVNS